jgi:hypothetical protein
VLPALRFLDAVREAVLARMKPRDEPDRELPLLAVVGDVNGA